MLAILWEVCYYIRALKQNQTGVAAAVVILHKWRQSFLCIIYEVAKSTLKMEISVL